MEWRLTERQLGELIYNSYKRGFAWAEENGFDHDFITKAAADYTDGKLHELEIAAAASDERSESFTREQFWDAIMPKRQPPPNNPDNEGERE